MVELIIHNARIRTMTAASDAAIVTDTAVAVAGGMIHAVGGDAEILSHARDETRIVDAAGATLTPGLIDSHCHPVLGCSATVGIDFGGMVDLESVRAAIAEEASRLGAGEWILGWNLDYKAFETAGIRGDHFDGVTGGRPLAVRFFDMHTGLANSVAMERSGVDGTETFADASEVVVDEDGTPTGELREIPAYSLVFDAVPQGPAEELAGTVQTKLLEMAASGVTGATIMDGDRKTLTTLQALEELPGGLPVRLQVALWHHPGDDDSAVAQRIALLSSSGRRFRVSMIKMFIDGVIDGGTAWLHQPDTHGESAEPFWPSVDRYAEVAEAYHRAGFQLATHSCGDAGVAHVTEVYSRLDPSAGSGAPHRIEHLETMTDYDVDSLVEADVVASMQPLHMQWREAQGTDPWAARLGEERASRAWRVKDVLTAGGRIALGSDWPVAESDARLGLAWARLRRRPGHPESQVFEPAQRLTGVEALLGYTRWAAEALGRDDLGTITPGSQADLALWVADPVETDPDELIATPVLLTTVAGEIIHQTQEVTS
ncbi:amidohydrolase [Nesterenkonia sp. K-15-9-6]|uniref:amidohydrolase n=1 Tax=Nesterenkonia sp. K-15-9-6 TaxID=3093918 RepID=UPI0040446A2D